MQMLTSIRPRPNRIHLIGWIFFECHSSWSHFALKIISSQFFPISSHFAAPLCACRAPTGGSTAGWTIAGPPAPLGVGIAAKCGGQPWPTHRRLRPQWTRWWHPGNGRGSRWGCPASDCQGPIGIRWQTAMTMTVTEFVIFLLELRKICHYHCHFGTVTITSFFRSWNWLWQWQDNDKSGERSP